MLQPVLPDVSALMTFPVGGLAIELSASLALYPLETIVSVRLASFLLIFNIDINLFF